MTKTVVGVFDDATSAQSVVRELEAAGISQNHIRVTSNTEGQATPAESGRDQSLKGRILSFFDSLFEDENDRKYAHHYAEAWRRGHHIVVADVDHDQADRVAEIMNRYGTVDLDRRAEYWKTTGYTGRYDESAAAYTNEERQRELQSYGKAEAIPVVQEELAVGKQVVRRGGVRIHSYVQERPVTEHVRLREERINVERRPVDRPATESDLAFKERTFDVTGQGEEAVVGKRARVVEEVVVGKQVQERDQTVQDTVRRKDVAVENIPADRAAPPSNRQAGPQAGPQRR
jgi:uncharacterized protein (TIGR02271 family)